jgi:hypothetical protein
MIPGLMDYKRYVGYIAYIPIQKQNTEFSPPASPPPPISDPSFFLSFLQNKQTKDQNTRP